MKASKGPGSVAPWLVDCLRQSPGPPAPPPGSPSGARAWLAELGGTELTARDLEGTLLVTVGAFGRSEEEAAKSSSAEDLDAAFMEAVLRLHGKL
jgi:hypothetical protein